jgi:hypothetical protein
MKHLARDSYFELLQFDYFLIRGQFEQLYKTVRASSVRSAEPSIDAIESICRAMDIACVWYFKRVLCLQRSAATTCLLRRHGIHAQLVIGAQQIPFRAHAWVEVDGRIVNDKPYIAEHYAILDRC